MHDTLQVTVTPTRPVNVRHRIESMWRIFFVFPVIPGWRMTAPGPR